VREALARFGGHEVDTAGDGFFATFARPTDAVACAAAIVTGVPALDLHVRAAVHIGEVEEVDGKAGGVAVHVAARLLAQARADEILVSSTVHELVAGGTFAFVDRGSLALKGLAQPVHAWLLDTAPAPAGRLVRARGPVVRSGTVTARLFALLGTALVVLLGAALLQGGFLAWSAGSSGSPTAPVNGTYTFGFAGPQHGVIGVDAGGNPELAPGRYTEADVQPSITLALTAGWSLSQPSGTAFALSRTSDPTSIVSFSWPTRVPLDACAHDSRPLSPTAVDYVEWLTHTPALQATTPTTRYFGTLVASQADVGVVAEDACPGTYPPALLLNPNITGRAGESWLAGTRYRVIVGAVGVHLLRIVIQAPDDQAFQAFDPLVEAMLDTLAVGPVATGP